MRSIQAIVNSVVAVSCSMFIHAAAMGEQPPGAEGYDAIKSTAEQFYAEGSYSKSRELYERARSLTLHAAEARWVEFRLADTAWRAQAATQNSDSTVFDKSRESLEALLRSFPREEDRDRVWVEASESLADFWWIRREAQNHGQAWPHYQKALDWWAGQSDLETARRRYLEIVWKVAEPPWYEEQYQHYHYASNIPISVLDNAAKVASTRDDQARAHYLIAMALRHGGGEWRQVARVPREFEAAIVVGKSAPWYDDALFAYAQWMMQQGPATLLESGQWSRQPDFISAAALFRRILREFEKGQTRYYDDARNALASITEPVVGVHVPNIFLPGSEVQCFLNWRNVKQIDLALFRVDLTKDVRFHKDREELGAWQSQIDLAAAEPILRWTRATEDKDDFRPGQSQVRLEKPLEVGSYMLTASAGGKTDRAVILVTDAAIVLKAIGSQALVYACDALSSAPIPNATVRLWRFTRFDQNWQVHDAMKTTDAQGLCVFDRDDFPPCDDNTQPQYLAAISAEGRQAFATIHAGPRWSQREEWRLYAFTDRPAYRPGDTVHWKLIARAAGRSGFFTPAGESIHYEVRDSQGAKCGEGVAKLNEFGSAWGDLEVASSQPLGEYRIEFWKEPNHQGHIGSATLFRLEEYKLPEYSVTISTPAVDGRKKAFVLGDSVEVEIQADYYFGGPVANASVEVVLFQRPYHHWWRPQREFPWLYDDAHWSRHWGGWQGQVVKRETLRTGVDGKAILTFDTPSAEQQDLEFVIEARVVDSSRREIIASDSVRVTRQRYYVHPIARHRIYQPTETVDVDFTVVDPNGQPVQATGSVKVTREEWIEIWIDPSGREVAGRELRDTRRMHRIFPPPPPRPDSPSWRLKFQGYRTEDVLTATVNTDEQGKAVFSFTPQATGFYRVAWSSKDEVPFLGVVPITAETSVWVTRDDVAELGYHHGDLEIIVDAESVRAGQSAPVMIHTPTNDRYVLFSVEGNDLYSYQIVHVKGTVKLLHLPIDQRHVPNVYLNALMTHDGRLHQDQEEVIVPPVEQYLNVSVSSDRPQYQPGESGEFTVRTTDQDGKPVSAEVALAAIDEAVAYIQQDYAGDPRAFFFGERQRQSVQTSSTFQQLRYIRYVEDEKNQLIDEVERDLLKRVDPVGEWRSGELRSRMNNVNERLGMKVETARRELNGTSAPAAAVESYSYGQSDRFDESKKAQAGLGGGGGGGAGEPAIVVRSDFRSTLTWQPAIVTDEDGIAKITLKYGDALTTWKATARAAGAGQQFGFGSATTRTQMPLIARLQAPRFFLVGDSVTVSGVINNNTDEPQTVTPTLEAAGLTIAAMMIDGRQARMGMGTLNVPANSEARVDWRINVDSHGEAKLKLIARSETHADAMEKTYIVHEHGVERFLAKSGKVRGDEVTVRLDLPSDRKVESTVLTVQIASSMAVTMLDALPYLIDYPYGCTEQTMSRFLPAAITAKTLHDLGLQPKSAFERIFGGIEREHVAKTHPGGKRDPSRLEEVTRAGLERLYDFQHSDGGWGWWKEGESDHFMTAYVVWGLSLAKGAGIDIRAAALQRGIAFLDLEIIEQENSADVQAWMLHAIAVATREPNAARSAAMENLWTKRDSLNAYTRALLALAAHELGDREKATTLVRNLENGVKRDDRPDASIIVNGAAGRNEAVMATAHWGDDGIRWRWSSGGVEATAFALRALLAIDPKNALIEPASNWLIKNRRGAQWSNTRDTAIAVLAMNDYLRVSGELAPDMEYELFVNGTSIARRSVSAEKALEAPSTFSVDRRLIRNGENDVRIVRKSGNGPIYFAAQATFFSLEEPVPATGNEIFVRREYYKLSPRPTLLKGAVYDRLPLTDGGSVESGERVQVVMTIEAKNNYEYLVFEDLKPAGLEAVAVRSGEPLVAREMKSSAATRTFGDGTKTVEDVMAEQAHGDPDDYTGRNQWIYQELRDRKVALFIDKLPEGIWEIRYDLRAEAPGRFHALPVLGHAMYVPEIRCNSDELRISVTDAK